MFNIRSSWLAGPKLDKFLVQCRQKLKNPFVTYGLPFMVVIVLGPFALQHFSRVRYKYRKVTQVSEDELAELERMAKRPSREITLESEYEKLKDLDIDNWEQKRGPRPWEEQPGEGHGKKPQK